MPHKKKDAAASSQSVAYYTVRVIQRVSLLLAAASTMILWATLITVSHNFTDINLLQNQNLVNAGQLTEGLLTELTNLSHLAVTLSVVALLLTLVMLIIPRVVKYEKKLVVDGVVIATFLIILSACYQSILQFILSHIVN